MPLKFTGLVNYLAAMSHVIRKICINKSLPHASVAEEVTVFNAGNNYITVYGQE
jgi:hypothetical protein